MKMINKLTLTCCSIDTIDKLIKENGIVYVTNRGVRQFALISVEDAKSLAKEYGIKDE